MSSGETSGGNNRADGTGRLLAGRYRVLAQLGRGGMGVVWRAVDEVLGREVAVKELRTYTDADGPELADLRLRMQREARAAARVRHPGVVAVHDVAEVDGRPLIVMELVDGPSLEQVLRERGFLDPAEAAGIGAQVMDALAAAHRAGVLHRDVKPGNILLERSGRVVLTDFGIAAMDDPGDGAATHLTRSGALVGSLDYLAPERAQGADASAASDVWALGATLYAAVEGSSPFRRTSTFSTLTAIVTEPLPEPERAGPLTAVLRHLLDKRPDTRPEAEEARALLQAVADAGGTDTPTTTLRGEAPAPRTEPGGPPLPTAFVLPGAAAGPRGPGPATPAQHTAAAAAAADPSGRQDTVPGPGTAAPKSGPTAPGPNPAVAGSGSAVPGSDGAVPGSGSAVPGSDGAVPGPDGAVPGSGAPVPGSGAPVSGSGAVAPGSTPHTVPVAPASVPHAVPVAPASVPHSAPVTPGFGPPVPYAPVPDPASAPTGPIASPGAPRRKGRVLLAAAAVTVVLAAAGGTVALVHSGGEKAHEGTSASGKDAAASVSASGHPDAARSSGAKSTEQGAKKSPGPTPTGGGREAEATPTGRGSASATASTSGGGTKGGGTTGATSGGGTKGGGGATGGGTATTPAPACTPAGGGKYDCTVWRTAKSYTASGTEAGVLNAGVNYFYCQQNLGRRETYGQWTNVWWAKTDDDSGNTNVYVSDVYIKGGGNDEPVPGLPVC
ncbi:protein kinase domain-containing protein [Streptomyces sp. NPDC001139]